jgi:hypothetical protein
LFLRDHNIPPKRRPIYSNRAQRSWSPFFLLWGARNPVGPISASDVTFYSTGFPYYGGWMNRQPLWFRLVVLLPIVASITLGVIALFLR